MTTSPRRHLVVMVKEPRAGRVKTRLGRDIGMPAAAWWMRHQIRRLTRALTDPRWTLTLAISPDTAVRSRAFPHPARVRRAAGPRGPAALPWAKPRAPHGTTGGRKSGPGRQGGGTSRLPVAAPHGFGRPNQTGRAPKAKRGGAGVLARRAQGPGDLGDRMARVMRQMPPGPVAIIGADIPGLTRRDIADAFACLGSVPAVVGPAPDGGYWLVGLRRTAAPPRRLFKGVRWSTAQAMADTLPTLPQPVARIATRSDVDTAADL